MGRRSRRCRDRRAEPGRACDGLAAAWLWRSHHPLLHAGVDDVKFPPGYGYPSFQDWQRKTMEKFRAPWWKRLRRCWHELEMDDPRYGWRMWLSVPVAGI